MMVEPRSGEVCSVGNHNVSLLLLIFISYSSVKQYLTTFFSPCRGPITNLLQNSCVYKYLLYRGLLHAVRLFVRNIFFEFKQVLKSQA